MMLIRDIWKKFAVVLVLAVCVLLPSAGAGASSAAGSVYLQLPEEAKGVEFTLYRVADYQESGGFTYTGAFQGCSVSLAGIKDAQQAQNVAEQFWLIAQSAGISGQTAKASADSLTLTGLAPGYYLLVQTSGQEKIEVQKMVFPIPYVDEGSTALRYDVSLVPKYEIPAGAAIVQKEDDEHVPVAGARFNLERKMYITDEGIEPAALEIDLETGVDVGGRFIWELYLSDLETNDAGQLAVENLPLGLYRLIETKAPEGYFLDSSPVYFEIKAEGVVQVRGNSYIALEGSVEELTVVNKPTRVQVNKVDEDGKDLPGAYFVIKNADGSGITDAEGKPRFWFTTEAKPYVLKGLPPGDYLLCELFSPLGYVVAPDVAFSVSADPEAVNTVTMVDEKEEETVDRLQLTKYLHDVNDNTLAAYDGHFYVALFDDPERTNRVSDVKDLHYVGTSSATVWFENLQPDKTYYVGETDEFGVLLEGGMVSDALYVPEYPNGYEFTLSERKSEESIEMYNMFYDIPHEGFYISGELNVTKQTLLNGEPYPMNGKFYVGIFTDPGLTQREGDVIEISMEGGDAATVTQPVFIGETADSSVTYYIAETDKNGRPLNPDRITEYTISVDHPMVTLSVDNPVVNVVVTNDFTEEQTETIETDVEIETEQMPNSPDSPGSPDSSTATPGPNAPRTGDDTPIALYVGLLAAALVVLVIAVVVLRRRKKK